MLSYVTFLYEDCEAKQFWLLARHGTRNPGTEDMQELEKALPLIRKMIVDNHSQGLGSLCVDDIDNLLDWRFRANVTEDKFLVKEGYKELEGLGDRFQDRFPGLLTKTFTNESYVVRKRRKNLQSQVSIGVFIFSCSSDSLIQKGLRLVQRLLQEESLAKRRLQMSGIKSHKIQTPCSG